MNHFLFLLIFILSVSVTKAQINSESLYKKISYGDIYKADVNNIIKIRYREWTDSINCDVQNGKLWFELPTEIKGHTVYGYIFGFDDNNKKLYYIKDTPITLSSVYYRSLDLYQFNNNLFYIRGSESNEKIVKKMFVLDTKNMKLEKEVPIAANCFIDSVNIINDTLNIFVQHYTKKLDMLYYVFFWLRRGRPEKYEYVIDSTATYRFDKNFKRI